MAKIVLNVDLSTKQAVSEIEKLKKHITGIASELGKIEPNEELTKQLNALAKSLNAVTKNMKAQNDEAREMQMHQQKLETELKKTEKATAEAAKRWAEVAQAQEKANQIAEETAKMRRDEAREEEERAKAEERRAQSALEHIETLRKGYTDLLNTLQTAEKSYPQGTFDDIRNSIEDVLPAIKEFSEQWQSDAPFDEDDLAELREYSNLLKTLRADFSDLRAFTEKAFSTESLISSQSTTVSQLTKRYSDLLSNIKNIEKYYPKGTFDDAKKQIAESVAKLTQLNGTLKEGQNLSPEQIAELNKQSEAFRNVAASVAKLKAEEDNAHGSLKDLINGFLKFQIAAMLVMKPLQLLRSAWSDFNETLVETEKAVVQLQRVLPEDSASNKGLADDLYGMAQEYGQTFENVSEIARNFARTGMDYAEVLDATSAALLALNVAELDASQASDGMIAIMTQFNITAGEMVNVVDELNHISDHFPVTTEKLLTALQRTGSSAKNANMSLEETIALITTLSKATGRSGENLGTAINSLINYSSKDKALQTFSAVSDEMAKIVGEYKKGAASILDIWTGLSKEINNLTDEQADLLDAYFTTDEGSSLAQELGSELGDIYDDLSGVYSTANTFRKNYFIALLKNLDTVKEVQADLADAQGYSEKENLQYLDTYEARLNTLNAHWQKLANDEQGFLAFKKGLVSFADRMLSLIEATGGLRTSALAAFTVVNLLFGEQIIAGAAKLLVNVKNLVTGFKAGATAAQGMSAALGWIGIIATTLSIVAGVVNDLTIAQDEATKSAKKLADSYKEFTSSTEESKKSKVSEIESLDRLVEVYDDLNNRTNLSTAQSNQLKSVVSELSKVYASLDFQLDSTTGKYTVLTSEIRKSREEMIKSIELEYISERGKEAYKTIQEFEGKYGSYSNLLNQYADALGKAHYYDAFDAIDAFERGYEFLYGRIMHNQWQNQANTLREILTAWDNATAQYNAYIDAVTDGSDKTTNSNNKHNEQLSDMVDKYGDIVDKLKEAQKEQQSQEKLLEKQNAVLEAQKELEEAIAKARQDYILSVMEDYLDAIDQAETLEEKQAAVAQAREEYKTQQAEKQLEIEEKKLAVEKAQKALEDAKNQRTSRVYNQQTGLWEQQAKLSDIEKAEEALAKAEEALASSEEEQAKAGDKVENAVKNLNDYLKNQAVKEIKKAISDGDTSADSVKNILNKWLGLGEGSAINEWGTELANKLTYAIASGEYDKSKVQSQREKLETAKANLTNYMDEMLMDDIMDLFKSGNKVTEEDAKTLIESYRMLGASEDMIQTILKVIKNVSGISLFRKTPTFTNRWLDSGKPVDFTYDSGGILQGVGGLKATADDEMVLPPALTRRLLSPVPLQSFKDFVNSLGILFDKTEYLHSAPKTVNTYGGNNSYDNSRSYTLNAIPVPVDAARTQTIEQLVKNMRMFSN